MAESGELTPDQKDILKTIQNSTAHDLTTPQQSPPEVETLLDQLDQQPPAEKGQEDQVFEDFLKQQK